MVQRRWVAVGVALIVGAAAGLFYLEQEGFQTEGWQIIVGEGPDEELVLDGTAGFDVEIDVNRSMIDGPPSIYGRYLGELEAGSSMSMRWEGSLHNETVDEIMIGSKTSLECPLDGSTNDAGSFAAGSYEIQSEPGACRILVNLNETPVDNDNSPIEWQMELDHATPGDRTLRFQAGAQSSIDAATG